jgi:type IV pilus assembly protein PilA
MLYRLRQHSNEEGGFTLIELLVVILIIGILAAIAIPSFLNQKSKASDASAKELARTAQTTAETIATDNNGSYSSIKKPLQLNEAEKTIPIEASTTAAYLSGATEIEEGKGFEVTATAEPSGDTFTVKRNAEGTVTHVCVTPSGKAAGGCPASGGSW